MSCSSWAAVGEAKLFCYRKFMTIPLQIESVAELLSEQYGIRRERQGEYVSMKTPMVMMR